MHRHMGMQLYDLAGAESERRFSPYCWRIKLALMHKGLPFDTIPWRFTEKNAIAFSGQGCVPVLIDGDQVRIRFLDNRKLFRGQISRSAVTVSWRWRPRCDSICQCLGGCGFGRRHFAVDCDRHSRSPR